MPAYVIFIRERTLDQSELEAYAQMAPPSLRATYRGLIVEGI